MAESLGEDAVRLALTLVASPHPVLSGSAYRALSGAAELRASGLLVQNGYEPIVARRSDNDEEPVVLDLNDGEYQRYSDSGRPIAVAPEHLLRWRLDVPAFIEAMTENWPERTAGFKADPVAGEVWDLGNVPLRHRQRAVSFWFAPRAGQARVWARTRDALMASLMNGVRVLLTANETGDQLTFRPPFVVPMALPPVVMRSSLTVDLDVIEMRLDQGALWAERQPVEIVGNGEEVRLYNDVFRFPRGSDQRRVIVSLYEYLQRGERTVSSALLLDGLDFPEGTRLRDLFKGSPAWGRLIREVGGVVGFCL